MLEYSSLDEQPLSKYAFFIKIWFFFLMDDKENI